MEGNADGTTNMDVGDSRKRPLDTDSDDLTTKRSNYGQGERKYRYMGGSAKAKFILADSTAIYGLFTTLSVRPWTLRPLDDLPPGRFAPWLIRPLDDFRHQDISPPGPLAPTEWTYDGKEVLYNKAYNTCKC